ncbi:hypothetical protein CLOSTMETH_02895 [[Clostridium] methylpentosum DSM 5476]|uniref:Uncharacterized protein n=1 Tax=[Clostridium] methylpentosum DSM 5476 TaxID=537013 RepID=C0EGA2_9FIRM|nr:hypothetical protein CLOSTMETH_02895 [[Clostridium] methylpentosum DSM 5476]
MSLFLSASASCSLALFRILVLYAYIDSYCLTFFDSGIPKNTSHPSLMKFLA